MLARHQDYDLHRQPQLPTTLHGREALKLKGAKKKLLKKKVQARGVIDRKSVQERFETYDTEILRWELKLTKFEQKHEQILFILARHQTYKNCKWTRLGNEVHSLQTCFIGQRVLT